MIDLHVHLLPNVDDGPTTADEALRMCSVAAASGCEALVATPHQRREWPNRDRAHLELKLAELREGLKGNGPELYLGAEIRAGHDLLDELEREDFGGLLSLAGSRYLLVEFDPVLPATRAEDWLHELMVAGWTPIIAHPEVTPALARDPDLVRRLADLGAKLQVTAASLTGELGAGPRRFCFDLIDEGRVHFVASDAHSADWRPPGLDRAHAEIRSRWGDATARRLTRDNPRAVLDSRELPR